MASSGLASVNKAGLEPASYRGDIQGLRALSVLAVTRFHLPLNAFPNGFAGVDVFFVISGYVILASSERKPSTSPLAFAVDFLRKRVARLLPALLVCVVLVEICLLAILPPGFSKTQSALTGLYALSGFANTYLQRINLDYWFEGDGLNPLAAAPRGRSSWRFRLSSTRRVRPGFRSSSRTRCRCSPIIRRRGAIFAIRPTTAVALNGFRNPASRLIEQNWRAPSRPIGATIRTSGSGRPGVSCATARHAARATTRRSGFATLRICRFAAA